MVSSIEYFQFNCRLQRIPGLSRQLSARDLLLVTGHIFLEQVNQIRCQVVPSLSSLILSFLDLPFFASLSLNSGCCS